MPYSVPPAPALLGERVELGEGGAVVLRLDAALRYRLEYRRGARVLVVYEHAGGDRHSRSVQGRAAPYAFRSVEQLRYDFERDLEALA